VRRTVRLNATVLGDVGAEVEVEVAAGSALDAGINHRRRSSHENSIAGSAGLGFRGNGEHPRPLHIHYVLRLEEV
jgi:hypothetical protein